ncbi:hypothetical protein BHE90_003237 [Fusarium euwallaceae]|uniref:Uncharacterized protein n=1 Tax=Fusarium euwallaceae TaxID=1147111 RepID=A0A430M2X6_9HYPO|nr:hypothetical protein BHE90_003237 [Fusarium euwallaceae]
MFDTMRNPTVNYLAPNPESGEEKARDTAPQDSDGLSLKPAAVLNPPPNGGLKAWLNVLGSFMLSFNTWGILNTFGAY